MDQDTNYKFVKLDIEVNDDFIAKSVQRYLALRSESAIPGQTDIALASLESTGFNAEAIKKVLIELSVPQTTGEGTLDILRSDLGEMLAVNFFEHKLNRECPDEQNFIIPIKNISYRESADMPGRGSDAIGYRLLNDGRTSVLLAEAKVSSEKKNPPQVVHNSADSLYKTHIKFKKDRNLIARRLADYAKRLEASHATVIMASMINILHQDQGANNTQLVFGSCLVRDKNCVDLEKDLGKVESDTSSFIPDHVHGVLLCFSKSIDETVGLFKTAIDQQLSK